MFEVILSPEARAFYAEADVPLPGSWRDALRNWSASRAEATTSGGSPENCPGSCGTA